MLSPTHYIVPIISFAQSKIQFISTAPWYWSINHSGRSRGLAARQPVSIAFPAHPPPLPYRTVAHTTIAQPSSSRQIHRLVSRTVRHFFNSSDNRAPRCLMPTCLSARFASLPSFLPSNKTDQIKLLPALQHGNAPLLQFMISDLAFLFPSISPPSSLLPLSLRVRYSSTPGRRKKKITKKKQSGKPTVSH